MTVTNLFTGKLVHLTAEEPEVLAKAAVRWNQDSEFGRMLDSDPYRLFSEKKIKEWHEKGLEKDHADGYFFNIRPLDSDQPIGFVGLFDIHWNHGDAMIGIGIGDRENWSKGFGSEAMNLLLQFAFIELNLRRASLVVFEYNPRAIRSYEKCGFTIEGRVRQVLQREGRRWDFFYMGILKEEWKKRNSER
jgi:RimJ/RimL family protein N-acetyltransferase